MKIIYLSIISVFILAACNSPKLKYCENEYLLIHHDDLKAISLDFEQSDVDFEQQLLKELEVDSICSGSDLVGLPLDLKTDGFHKSFGAVNIPVVFYNGCWDKNEPIYMRIEQRLTTFLNADNEALIRGEPTVLERDSIVQMLQQNWEHSEMDFLIFRGLKFLIHFDTEAKSQSVKIIIDAYTQFYLKKLDAYCRKAYDLELCNADKTIIQELKENYPFKIHICYNGCSLMPPPPPPLPE